MTDVTELSELNKVYAEFFLTILRPRRASK